MGLFQSVNMTQGNPVTQVVRFTMPLLVGNIAQQLYNTVDSIIVGRYVGDNALAAVGSAGPLLNIMIVLFIGIGAGAGIVVSQYYGAKRREDLSRAVCSSIILTILASLALMVSGPLLARPMLKLLNTPDSILNWCQSYLSILFLGALGGGIYNILSGVLRGLGDSISALIYLLVAVGSNIVLDFLFVAYLGMGVSGVAWATVLAQLISAVLCLVHICRLRDTLDIRLEYFRINRKDIMPLITLGLPSGVTQAITSMSAILIQSLMNSYGEQFIAASTIVSRIDGFVILPALSFGTAMTTFSGQNIGARKLNRVIYGTRQATMTAMGVSALLMALILLFGRPLMGIFTQTEELIDLSYSLIRILAVGYIVMTITQCLSGIMRGAGDTLTPMWISILTSVGLYLPLTYGLVFLTRTTGQESGNYYMIYVSLLICWIIGALITFVFYERGSWKSKALASVSM